MSATRPLLMAASKEPPDGKEEQLPISAHPQVSYQALSDSPNPELKIQATPQLEISELQRHQLELSSSDTNTQRFDITQSGISIGSWPVFIFYFLISSPEEVGTGIALGKAATIGILSAAAVFSIIPTAIALYLGYKERSEAISLVDDIQKEEQERKQQRDLLFFEALRLRCILDAAEFESHILALASAQGNECEVNAVELVKCINRIFLSDEFKQINYPLNPLPTTQEQKSQPPTVSLQQLFLDETQSSNSTRRNEVMQHFHTRDQKFQAEYKQCFNPIRTLPPMTSWKPTLYGITYGGILFGNAMNLAWTYPGVLIGSTIALAAIPVWGWAILLTGALIASIYFAKKMYDLKYRNIQREALKSELQTRNQTLAADRKQLENVYANKVESLKRFQQPTLADNRRVEQAEQVAAANAARAAQEAKLREETQAQLAQERIARQAIEEANRRVEMRATTAELRVRELELQVKQLQTPAPPQTIERPRSPLQTLNLHSPRNKQPSAAVTVSPVLTQAIAVNL